MLKRAQVTTRIMRRMKKTRKRREKTELLGKKWDNTTIASVSDNNDDKGNDSETPEED